MQSSQNCCNSIQLDLSLTTCRSTQIWPLRLTKAKRIQYALPWVNERSNMGHEHLQPYCLLHPWVQQHIQLLLLCHAEKAYSHFQVVDRSNSLRISTNHAQFILHQATCHLRCPLANESALSYNNNNTNFQQTYTRACRRAHTQKR